MTDTEASDIRAGHLLSRIGIGFIVALFNLQGFIAWAAISWSPFPRVTDVVLFTTQFADRLLNGISGSADALTPRLAHWVVTGFWWYFAATLLAGLLLWKPLHSVHAVGGLLAGLLWFPVVCWIGLILVSLLWICFKVVAFVVGAVAWIMHLFAPLMELLARVLVFLLPWVGALAVLAGVIAGVVWLARNLRGRPLLLACIAAGGAAVLYAFLPTLARFWFTTVVPVLQAIGAVLGAILGAVGPVVAAAVFALVVVAGVVMALAFVAGLLGLLGWLVADQFRAAWLGGVGRTSMSMSGFAVGTAAAMLLMVCLGRPEAGAALDVAWGDSAWLARGLTPAALFGAILPNVVEGAFSTILQDASAPVFDGLLLLALFACAGLGMFRLGEQPQELPVAAYLKDGKHFGILSGTALAAPLVVIIFAMANSSDS
jgi:hypothetical protein